MVEKESYKQILKKINHPNFILAEKSLQFYLSWIEEVIFTYSSVGEEAKFLGIKTTLLAFNYKINESPLMDIKPIKDKFSILYI